MSWRVRSSLRIDITSWSPCGSRLRTCCSVSATTSSGELRSARPATGIHRAAVGTAPDGSASITRRVSHGCRDGSVIEPPDRKTNAIVDDAGRGGRRYAKGGYWIQCQFIGSYAVDPKIVSIIMY